MSTPDLAPLYGKTLYVWEASASGGTEGVIAHARSIGANAVLVKAWDGPNFWSNQFTAAAVAAWKAAGLIVGAWGYVRPSDISSCPIMAKQAVTCGAQYLVLDVETEWEIAGSPGLADTLGAAMRKELPDTLIGFTTFALPKLHRQFPYLNFARWCDFVQPQVYFATAGIAPQAMLDDSLAQLSGYGKRIFPVGQAYPPATPAQIAMFGAYLVDRWIEGVSWWESAHLTPAIAQAVANVEVYVPPERKPPAKPVPKALTPAELYQQGYAAGIDAAIKQLEGMRK